MKKGFTLIELLAVIVIISITSMIIFPNVTKVINDSKEDLYKTQILDIQSASEKWASNNLDKLDETHANDIFISLESLRFSGYLEPDQIKNPRDRSVMDGCIRIRYNYDNKKYGYIYEEKTCSEYAGDTIESEVYGAIIYSYDRTAKSFVKDDSNEVKSTGLSIYDLYKNDIKIPGQTNDGLYDTGDEYVFRVSNVNNYVTLTANEGSNSSNSSWRILSINKKSNQVKLISTSSIASNVWNSNSEISFKSSSLNNLLLSKVSSDGIAYNTNKIINSDYSIGVVPPSEFSIEALRSALNDNSVVYYKEIAQSSYWDFSLPKCNTEYENGYVEKYGYTIWDDMDADLGGIQCAYFE